MQTVTTLLRAVVMILAVAIAWKGWQKYGPSNEQLRTIALRAIEIAQEAIDSESGGATPAPDPRLAPAPPASEPPALFAAAPPAVKPVIQVGGEVTPGERYVEPAPFFPDQEARDIGEGVMRLPEVARTDEPLRMAPAPGGAVAPDEVETAIAALESIGAGQVQLEPWGSDGNLYRCSCRVPWGESAAFTQHFEAIAPQALEAVQNLAEKLSAWRVARGGGIGVR